MPIDPATILEAAVQRSTAGSAEFTVRTELSSGYEYDGVLHGRIDFASDRCELGRDSDRIVHTNLTTYAVRTMVGGFTRTDPKALGSPPIRAALSKLSAAPVCQ